MVKNKVGGNKSKNLGSKFTKKINNIPEPDFENSFLAEMHTKPNGQMATVKLLPIPELYKDKIPQGFEDEYLRGPIQVNIGKLKHDKRNSSLAVGDVVQVELNYEMKRANGNTFAYILCKYGPTEIRQFKKNKWIVGERLENDDIFDITNESSGDEQNVLRDLRESTKETKDDISLDDL